MSFMNFFTSFFFKTTNDGLLEDAEENASRVQLLENASMVDSLIENASTSDTSNRSQYSPLHPQTATSHNAIVQLLVANGAIDAPDPTPTPLHLRAYENSNWMRNYLVSEDFIFLLNPDESELPRYTRSILKGGTLPGAGLPEWLATRKDLIDTTLINWLAPLKISNTVSLIEAAEEAKAAYLYAIPSILRALPRLLKWVEVSSKAEKSLPVFDDDDDVKKAETCRKMLMDFLLASVDEDEKLENEKRQLEATLADRLNKLPDELLLLIREINIQTTIVQHVKKHYPKIPDEVADYLVAEMMFDSNKVCAEFYENLFTHHWKEPLEPPLTQSMIKAREKRFETPNLTVRYLVS